MIFTFTQPQLQKLSKSDLIQLILTAQNVEAPAPLVDEPIGTEVIAEYVFEGNRGEKIIKINGSKFKIYFESSNGAPMGFNYKKCAKVMNSEGSWDNIAEAADINFDFENCSYVSDIVTKRKTGKRFMDEMQKYLEKIYS